MLFRTGMALAFLALSVALAPVNSQRTTLTVALSRIKIPDALQADLLLLLLVGVGLLVALFTEALGLSLEAGALLAGRLFATAADQRSLECLAGMKPLSAVFSGMYFASMGMILNPKFMWEHFMQIFLIVFGLVTLKVCFGLCLLAPSVCLSLSHTHTRSSVRQRFCLRGCAVSISPPALR